MRDVPTTNQTCIATNQAVAACSKLLHKVESSSTFCKRLLVARFTGLRQTCFATSDVTPGYFIHAEVSIYVDCEQCHILFGVTIGQERFTINLHSLLFRSKDDRSARFSIHATRNKLIFGKTGLNVGDKTRNDVFSTCLTAMLQNKLGVFVVRFTVA